MTTVSIKAGTKTEKGCHRVRQKRWEGTNTRSTGALAPLFTDISYGLDCVSASSGQSTGRPVFLNVGICASHCFNRLVSKAARLFSSFGYCPARFCCSPISFRRLYNSRALVRCPLTNLDTVICFSFTTCTVQLTELSLQKKNRPPSLFSLYYLLIGPMTLGAFDVDRIQALLALLDIVGYFVVFPKFFAGR